MSRMTEPLEEGKVIGDVVDTFIPSVTMNVTYNNNTRVSNGHELVLHLITSAPRVDIGGEDMRFAYTLIMTDPDVPSPNYPHRREHLHWIVKDILGRTDASFGSEIVKYEAPEPAFGIHRYVFLLFKQSARISMTPPASRDHFNTRTFCQQHGLGLPVAAVYFNAQNTSAAGRRRRYN